MSLSETALDAALCGTVVTPARSGATARSVTCFRLPSWTVAFTIHLDTAQNLIFTSSHISVHPRDWRETLRETLDGFDPPARNVLLLALALPAVVIASSRKQWMDILHLMRCTMLHGIPALTNTWLLSEFRKFMVALLHWMFFQTL